MTTPNDPTMSHDSLDAVIAAYMLAVEGGEVPNRQELLDQHAEHVDALRAFFADLDRMDRVASPLKIVDGLDATYQQEGNGHADLPTIRYFGDYVLLERIAKGGMGIVYKARQVSLNRVVALKMILQGTFATERDIARFRAEAEAAANLDHPHIVPIYEVGNHEGQQYYSMKLIEGPALSAVPPADPRREVQSLLPVIRAVHHAHQRGVLHRDLKPSNILVDASGNRHVTDFGLAKRISDTTRSITETGQILGTPKYMSPEQAAGRKDLTVATDVYSLGVILYERLTGQTPFTGENVLTVLRQARETEPPRPSSLQAGLDRDLETVVLKCLEKQPSRRYASAKALADDIDRWLRGEPIEARPVGRMERWLLWARRNPALAAAGSLSLMALVLVAIASLIAASQAEVRARAERRERDVARQAEENAIQARDAIEETLARSLVWPLNRRGETESTLSEPEAEALWRLSENQNDQLWVRFLDQATRDSITVRELRARSEAAMIATVGADPRRRNRAAKLLADRLRDLNQREDSPALDHQDRSKDLSLGAEQSKLEILSAQAEVIHTALHRADVALIALELEDRRDGSSSDYGGVVAGTLSLNLSDDQRAELNNHLACVSQFPARYQRLSTSGAGPLMKDEQNLNSESRLEPRVASRMLVAAIENQTSSKSLSTAEDRLKLSLALASVVCRLTKSEASEVCMRPASILAQDLEKITSDTAPASMGGDLMSLTRGLSSLARSVDPAAASTLCRPAVQFLAPEVGRRQDGDRDYQFIHDGSGNGINVCRGLGGTGRRLEDPGKCL